MGVDFAASDFVASRLGEVCFPETCQQRADKQYGTTQGGRPLDEVFAQDIVPVDFVRHEAVTPFLDARHLYSHKLEHGYQVPDIPYFRDVGNFDRTGGQDNGTDDLKGFVLCPLGGDFSLEGMASFYNE